MVNPGLLGTRSLFGSLCATVKIVDVAVQDSDRISEKRSKMSQLVISDQIIIVAGNEMIQKLVKRASRLPAELKVLLIMKAAVSFGNSGRRGPT